MSCKDFFGFDVFYEDNIGKSKEKMLGDKYLISVQMKEDLHIQDQKYWIYYNHVLTLRKADEGLFDKINKIHQKQREFGK